MSMIDHEFGEGAYKAALRMSRALTAAREMSTGINYERELEWWLKFVQYLDNHCELARAANCAEAALKDVENN